MPADERTAHIDGPARLALVDSILDAVDDICEQTPLVSPEDRAAFSLAVSEVATNMVQHGGSETPVTLSVDLRLGDGELRAALVDTAPPASIDWHGVAMPDVDAEGGRGLALAQSVLDEITHSYDESGNTWVLRRRLTGGPTPH
ncbi:ATP-binding protein [Microbacterium sp. H83]|uniref:ATP-binding protein n=1 Tax=Microbacterium sp. H83 TaxID=1827324 RepID=UPI0007F54EA3|nr:ATP-binding protein [Microbacterium sp. H83]OAN39029.1 hypothetical protein A4X16_15285 [Microbacterium sp. H83]